MHEANRQMSSPAHRWRCNKLTRRQDLAKSERASAARQSIHRSCSSSTAPGTPASGSPCWVLQIQSQAVLVQGCVQSISSFSSRAGLKMRHHSLHRAAQPRLRTRQLGKLESGLRPGMGCMEVHPAGQHAALHRLDHAWATFGCAVSPPSRVLTRLGARRSASWS